MTGRVLIIKNVSHEGPGRFGELLNEWNINYDTCDLSRHESLPEPNSYELILILGGPDSANDISRKILMELVFVKRAFKGGIPILGICLGMQLMVKAAGGNVIKSPIEEIGFKHEDSWQEVHLTPAGSEDPIFLGIKEKFKVFQMHGETVQIPNETKLLGTGRWCKNQIIKFDPFYYGMQFHLELTEDLLKNWLNNSPELKNANNNQLQLQFEEIGEEYAQNARVFLENYLDLLEIR